MGRIVEELHPEDERWPAELDALGSPPSAVWTVGASPPRGLIAIVGTRRADRGAIEFTERIASALAREGVGVISGGARGIDRAAHEGALTAGGRTWVVHATPLHTLYPPEHEALFERALERGGWVTEVPPNGHASRARFIARNRLIAALADAVLVVQAPARSGALSTARVALKLGRPLLAVPASPWDRRGDGCRALLRSGAIACESAEDVVAALSGELTSARARSSAPVAPKVETPPPSPALPPPLDLVLAALDSAPRHPDHLAEELGLGASELSVALIQLATRRLAVGTPTGWRRA